VSSSITSEPAGAKLRARFRLGQREAFTLAWLLYVALYLVRRNYDGTKPALLDGDPAALTKEGLAVIDTAYLVAYAGGSFFAGVLGDWLGARRVILVALAVAVTANVVFGLADSVAVMAAAQGVNGLAQACGFPLCVKIVAAWFPPSRRGSASSLFLTSYTLGDFAAKGLAAKMVAGPGWRYAFFVPSALVLVFLAIVAWRLRASPKEAGLPDVAEVTGEAEPVKAAVAPAASFGSEAVELLRLPAMWSILSSYALLKLVRYVFVGWSNVFMFEKLGYSAADATLATLPMTLGGLAGTVASGWMSDRLFKGRRAPVVVIEIVGLALATVAYAQLTVDDRTLAVVLNVLVGFLVYGADSVLSAASAMDLGAEKGAATAAGIINGAGNVGAIASTAVGAFLSSWLGWTGAWYALAGTLLVSAILLAPRWNARGRA